MIHNGHGEYGVTLTVSSHHTYTIALDDVPNAYFAIGRARYGSQVLKLETKHFSLNYDNTFQDTKVQFLEIR